MQRTGPDREEATSFHSSLKGEWIWYSYKTALKINKTDFCTTSKIKQNDSNILSKKLLQPN